MIVVAKTVISNQTITLKIRIPIVGNQLRIPWKESRHFYTDHDNNLLVFVS